LFKIKQLYYIKHEKQCQCLISSEVQLNFYQDAAVQYVHGLTRERLISMD